MKTFHKTKTPTPGTTEERTFSPLLYTILGSLATIGLLVGTLTLIPKSISHPPSKNPIEEKQQLEARGSGRKEPELTELLLRVEGLLEQIVEKTKEEEEEQETDVATKGRRRKSRKKSP